MQNIAADRERKHEIWQQNMEYLNEKGCSSAYHNGKFPEDFGQRDTGLTENAKKPRSLQAVVLRNAAATAMPLCPVCTAA